MAGLMAALQNETTPPWQTVLLGSPDKHSFLNSPLSFPLK